MVDTWDEGKRQRTLAEQGLDFAKAWKVFEGEHFTRVDDRHDYGEGRFITAGYLDDRFVVLAWTRRDGGRRITSMRNGHAKEERRFKTQMGRSG